MKMASKKHDRGHKFNKLGSPSASNGAGMVGKDGIVFDTDSSQLAALGAASSSTKKRAKRRTLG